MSQRNELLYTMLGNMGYTQFSLVDREYAFLRAGGFGEIVVSPAPDPGTGYLALTTNQAGITSVDLAWDFRSDPDPTHDGFILERKKGTGAYEVINNPAQATRLFTDSGLDTASVYTYRIKATNGAEESVYSNESQARTGDLLSPYNLDASMADFESISMVWEWLGDESGITGYEVERAMNGSGNFITITDVTPGTTKTYTNNGLVPDSIYTYRVRAEANGSFSGYSNESTTATGELHIPETVSATATSSTQVEVTWGDTSPYETGFEVQYKLSSGTTWTTATITGQNVESYVVGGLTSDTSYDFRVRGVYGTYESEWSAVATESTQAVVPGIIWTSRQPASEEQWFGVTYGEGLFVAVSSSGTGNRVMTSTDAISWTTRTSAADNNWRDVAYGNGVFVAVAVTGTGNRVMTSPDGINWTARSSASDISWGSVVFANGLFVTVASSGAGEQVMTSPDGINWTARSTPVDLIWSSVTFGGGLFVAVATTGTGNRVMTSPDGITWTIRTSAGDNNWFGVTYGNGLFVAVAITGTGNRVMTSPDGINWTMRSTPVDNDWYAVTYGSGLFVAVSLTGSGNRVMTSPDGINWTTRTSAADNPWRGICHGNDTFVAVANAGSNNHVMTSP